MSASRGNGPSKVKIRPVKLKNEIVYQASATEGPKVFHKNYTRTELIAYLEAALKESFGQLQASGAEIDGTVLVSKKGKVTVKVRRHPA